MAKYYSKQELIQALQEMAEKIGRTPQPADMTDPSAKVILGYYKKWSKALKAAGIQDRAQTLKKTVTAVKADEDHVEPIETKNDETVSATESTEAAVAEKAEKTETESMQPTKAEETSADAPCARRYSKSIIKKMLLDECNRLGKKPTRKEIDENKDLPTVSTILKYFETTRIGDVWNEVLK